MLGINNPLARLKFCVILPALLFVFSCSACSAQAVGAVNLVEDSDYPSDFTTVVFDDSLGIPAARLLPPAYWITNEQTVVWGADTAGMDSPALIYTLYSTPEGDAAIASLSQINFIISKVGSSPSWSRILTAEATDITAEQFAKELVQNSTQGITDLKTLSVLVTDQDTRKLLKSKEKEISEAFMPIYAKNFGEYSDFFKTGLSSVENYSITFSYTQNKKPYLRRIDTMIIDFKTTPMESYVPQSEIYRCFPFVFSYTAEAEVFDKYIDAYTFFGERYVQNALWNEAVSKGSEKVYLDKVKNNPNFTITKDKLLQLVQERAASNISRSKQEFVNADDMRTFLTETHFNAKLTPQSKPETRQFIKYITYPAYAEYDEMIRQEITLYSDGSVTKTEYHTREDKLISSEQLFLPKPVFIAVEKALTESNFALLPEEIATNTLDGSYQYIEVVTGKIKHKSGGLNVRTENKQFAAAANIVLNAASKASKLSK